MNTQQFLPRFVKPLSALIVGIAFVCMLPLLFGGFSPVGAAPLGATVPVVADITADETWMTGDTYVVDGEINVRSGATLTIEPGVVVSFTNSSELIIDATGFLNAVGTTAQPIQFTGNPGICTWDGLQLKSDDNTIRHAEFEYAARAIYINDGDGQKITSNTFQNNGGCSLTDFLSGAISGFTDGSLISQNVFTNNNTAIYLKRSGGNTISRNVISGTIKNAIFFDKSLVTPSSSNRIMTNTVHNAAEYGISLAKGLNNTVSGNEMYDNGGGMSFEEQSSSIFVRDNLIYDNQQGVQWGSMNIATPALQSNVICRNANYQIHNEDPGYTLPAAPNWWGENNPTIGGPGADIQGDVDIDPRIVLTATAATNTLPADGVSTTAVTIRLNGGGTTVPDGKAREITVAPASNVSPTSLTLDSNGEGQVTYTAGTTPGPVILTVTDLCGSNDIPLSLVVAPVDVAIDKTSPQTDVELGENITYTITYSNNTPLTATNVVITDDLPGGMVWITDTAESQGFSRDATSPHVIWHRDSLGPAESGAFTLVAQVPSGSTSSCGQTLTNTVSITSTTTDDDPSNNSASHSGGVTIDCPLTLAITKTLLSTADSFGKPTTFAITYRNTSAIAASNVVITDFLDTGVVYESDTFPGGTAMTTTTTVTWNVGALGPGEGDTFEIALSLGDPTLCKGDTISFTNQASIGSGTVRADSDIVSSGNIPCDEVDLVIVKNDHVGTGDPRLIVQAGESITYTISVNNLGAVDATNVVLTETLPTGTMFVGLQGANGWFRVGTSNRYTYSMETLPGIENGITSGKVVTFTVRVDPNLSCTVNELVNTVTVNSDGPEAALADNTVNEQTPVECNPLEIDKTTDVLCALPGDLVDYNIAVTNNSDSAANDLLLTEFLPDHTTFQGPNGVWTDVGGDTFTHGISSLGAGNTTSTPFSVQVNKPLPASVTAITNVVRLEPGGLEATLTLPIEHNAPDLYVVKNDNIELVGATTSEAITRIERKVGSKPWLDAVKSTSLSAQAISAEPGDVLSYTIGFGNAGVATAANVVITETLPANTSFVGPLYWTHLSGNTYVYTITNLTPGSGGQLDFRVRIDDPFPVNTIGVTNTIQIGSDAPVECDLSDNINVEFTRVQDSQNGGPSVIYLPLILKQAPPDPDPDPDPGPTPSTFGKQVVIDPATRRGFVSSPFEGQVHVFDVDTDSYMEAVDVGIGPTGLAVLTSTTPSRVLAVHSYDAASGLRRINASTLNPTLVGYVGSRPERVAVNPLTQRAFVSNYNDRLAIINTAGAIDFVKGSGISGGYTAGYGIDVNPAPGLIYQATIDSGKLVIFDETGAVNDAQNSGVTYQPCLLPPPSVEGSRVFRMVAVDPTTNLVFVTSPPDPNKGQSDNKVYVVDQTALLNLVGTPSAAACSGLTEAQRAEVWVASVTLPGANIGGQEGLAINSLTKRVYVSDAPANKLFVLDSTPGNISLLATIDNVGDTPYGVTVDEQTNKIYIANAHDQNATHGTVSVVDGHSHSLIKTIHLTP